MASEIGMERVCSRCLALKDTIVGYTDESGVTLPPLHPRCRCAIIYDEDLGRDKKPNKPSNNISGAGKPLTPAQIKEIRDAEDVAYNAKTGADFGFKKMKTPSDWTREILLTNPPDKIYGHTPNCQRCVVAHEARMRGYDVIARPSYGAEDKLRNSGEWLRAFNYSDEDLVTVAGKTGADVIKSAKKIMRSFGEGARAVMVFKWLKTGFNPANGHVIVIQCRENGGVNFGDPQTRKRAVEEKLKAIDASAGVILLRVDNLEFTDIVKCCCKNKE